VCVYIYAHPHSHTQSKWDVTYWPCDLDISALIITKAPKQYEYMLQPKTIGIYIYIYIYILFFLFFLFFEKKIQFNFDFGLLILTANSESICN
jgi:hypothetical protein